MKSQQLSLYVGVLTLAVASTLPSVAAPRVEGGFSRTLKVNGAVDLHVTTGAGTIKISKGSGNEVHVTARITAGDNWGGFWSTSGDPAELVKQIEQNPPVKQEGNRIVIGTDVRKWEHVSISYDISTPAETRVNAGSGSGNVEAFDVHGPAELSTGSGSVQAERIGAEVRANTGSGSINVSRTGGGLRASTGSGRIEASDISGEVEATTGSGNITILGATGKIRAHAASGHVKVERAVADLDVRSSSGGLEVEGSPKSAHWDLETASGTVRVLLPRDAGFELDAHAGAGSVSTTHQVLVSGTMRRGELRGVAGKPDNHLRIRTASGSIHID